VLVDPESYDARYNLGIVLAKMQDASGAKEQLERAIALGSNEPQVHFELARVLQSLGDKKAAKEQTNIYLGALHAESNRDLAQTESARAAGGLANGNVQSAVKHYRQAVEAVPNDPLLRYKLGMALDRAGDIDGERAILEQSVAIDPTLAVAQYQLGYLAGRRGDSVDAEKRFRIALKAAPGYVSAWISLAAILGMESQLPEAREAIAQALRLDPTNEDALHLSHDLQSAQP
jgi:Flp pilus assembly protein TadD